MRRLESRGLVQLPSPLKAARRPGYQNKVPALTLDRSPVTRDLAAIQSESSLAQVRCTAAEKRYNSLIHTYH